MDFKLGCKHWLNGRPDGTNAAGRRAGQPPTETPSAELVSYDGGMRVLRGLLAACITTAVVLGVAGCGSAGELPADAVAKVGASVITKASFDRSQAVVLGADFAEKVGGPVPAGLLSKPPTYSSCVSALDTFAGGLRGAPERETKCRELSEGVKLETLTNLIYAAWREGETVAAGVKVSAAEVQQRFAQLRTQQFPTEVVLQEYLHYRGWTFADEMSSVRAEVQSEKLLQVFSKDHARAASYQRRWVAKTSCRAGYVVEQCRQYKASARSTGAPDVALLLEEIRATRK